MQDVLCILFITLELVTYSQLNIHLTGAYLGTPTHGFKFSLTLAIEPMDPILYSIISKTHGFKYSLQWCSLENEYTPFMY